MPNNLVSRETIYVILEWINLIYMGAPKGNQFWKLRSSHGRDKLFETPELLWEAAGEYFNWVDSHPWYKVEAVKGPLVKKEDKLIKVPMVRPYTLTGFLLYIGASTEYWREFKKADHKDFLGVIDEIENVMYTQKLEGAAVGAFNANIISRDLGLSDKQQHEITGKDGEKLFADKSEDDLKALLSQTIRKLDD